MSSPSMFKSPPELSTGTVVGISIAVVFVASIITYFAYRYFNDQRYQLSGNYEYENSNYLSQQALDTALKGYINSSQLQQHTDTISKQLQDSSDMMSQQMKNTLSLTSKFFRSIGFVRISPTTLLITPVTSGQTTGFGGLPSCISKGSPLYVLYGSSAFVEKVMAVKDDNPSATVLEAIMTSVKSIGTESFRFRRRRQDKTATITAVSSSSVNPYQIQLKANLFDQLPSGTSLNGLSAQDKTLLSSFASKYCFVIADFDANGFPVISNFSKLYPTTTTTAGISTTEPMFTTVDKTSTTYKTIIMDIYRFYPTLLNQC